MKSKHYSRKREAILEKIRTTTCHPTADWVYQNLKPEIPDLSLGTVYRNIALFKKEGEIQSVATVDGQERFDGLLEPHGHFICQECGSIHDVELPTDQTIFASHVKNAHKCHIAKIDYTAYGVCSTCIDSSPSTATA